MPGLFTRAQGRIMKTQRVAPASRRTLVSIAVLLLSVLAHAQSPSITSISPSSGVVGMPVQITGSGFGAMQGSSTVTLNGTSASATSWSDGSITVLVPTGATSGPFLVTVGGQGASSASFTVNALPSGWTDTDIGTVGLAGSSSYANGTFTVKGAGAGIWSTADAFHFVYQPLSGNGSIVARVVNMPVGAVAGVMVRETLNAGAMNGKTADYLSSSTYAYVGFDIRTSTGGSTTEPSYVSGTLPPYWVELVRNGSTFSSYTSPDGINWTQLGSNQTIGMATNAYVGLGVSSRSTSLLATVTFDNVSVSPASSPGPVISSVSATTGNAGSQVVLSGSGFGSSQGTSLVTLNALPVVVNSWSATSITVTIPSSATTGIMVASVGPSMNDSNPIWFTVTAQPLPSGWLDGDIGAVGKTGSAGYANGVFAVNGAGTNFAGTADAFHFVYQPMSGNGSIVARVVSAPVGSSAGVMVRETLNPGATNAITLAYPTNSTGGYINFDMRTTTGGSLTNPAFLSGPHPPYWVEVVRSGNTFSSYASPDGINWTEIGSPQTITMAQNVYVGLIMASGSTSSLAAGTFDNVSVSSATMSAPIITSVSATTGGVGTQVVINGSGFGASQGTSLVTLNAAPLTIDTWDNTAITVTIPGSATSGVLVVSLGPSMDDSNPVWFTVTTQPLPSGWVDGDIGAVGKAGSATYSSGVFTVNGAGNNIWGTADAFHFAYLPVTGNGTLIARVVSMPAGSQAGAMVRETLNAGATNAKTADHLVSGTSAYVDFDVRTSTGGSTSEPGYMGGGVPPYWVKVVRSGGTFSGYTSTNGTSWTQLGTNQTINMAQNAYVGLAVDSGNTTSLATATFDNVSSTFGAQIVAPSIAAVSPTSSVPLVPVTITGSNFGSSQGSSTVTFNGVPATPTSWNSTTIVVPVPLTAMTGNVVVTVNGASSNGVPFTVSQTPTINSLSPSAGPVGTSVTINGVNFGSSQGSSTVTFNGIAATPTSWSSTAIMVPVPTGATTGNVVVTVNGTASSGVPFTVYPIPNITSLSASSTTIGASITITGNNFGSSAGSSTVTFNGVAGTPTSWSSTSIVVLVPFGATTGNVVVTENGIASNSVPITITMVSLPAVSQVLPANGSTGVPENGRVVVRFAQPVPQTALIPGTVSLSQGTTAVSGTLTLSNDGLSVTFIPAQNLAATTAFNVSVTDLTGNQSSPEFQSTFTTGSTTDTVAPSLVQTSPQNTNTGLQISAPIVVQFSKAMDPGTLTPQTFTVADTFTGKAINGMVQVDPTGTTASFVPQPNLAVGRTFLVQLHTTIDDQAGNSLTSTGADTFSFTTSFSADTTAPQVVGMSPSNGAAGVPLNSLIVLQFSKPLDVISVSQGLKVQAGGQMVPGAIALSSGNQLVTFMPTGGLGANTTYTISITSQITDVGGLALSNPQSFSLTTGAATDATTPSVATVSPQNAATGVPVNGIVQVQFSKAVDPFTVTTASLQALVGSNTVVPGTISVSNDGLTATFTPSSTLSAFTLYQVEATTGITDPEGHPLASFQSRFTTGATTAGSATVQMISPPNGATGVPANVRIDATVSTALDPATVSNSVIAVSTGGNPVAGTVTLGNGGTTLTWLPTTLLTASTNYSVTLSGVTDQAGNLLTPFTSSFTTAASGTANTTTPSVVSVSPANGATAVPTSSVIVLTFNEAIDLTSVSDTTVPIQVSSLGAVAGSYALDSTGTVLTFTPLSPLPGNATVSVSVINQGLLDLSGNLSGSYYSTFTTGTGTDTTSPTVTMVTPSNGATGITPNTPVVLTFSKSLNPNTVTAGNLAVLVNGTVQPEGISRSADNRVITLGGTSLAASSTVTVLATGGLTDLSGNPVVNFQSQFTTAAASVGPTVTSQRPGNGATQIPSTASVVLYLSQPMNASTLTGALHVSQNGVIVGGTTQVSDNGQVVQFFPSSSWLPSAVVQVFLDSSAQSVSGINLNAYQSSFTTAPNYSTTTPTLVATNPLNGQTLVPTNEVMDFAFNIPLDPNTLTADAMVCYQNGTWFQSDVGLIDGGTIIQIAPRYPLPANTGISCQVSANLQGANGVPLSGPTNLTFTTGTGPDTQLPTIQTVSPPNGSTNVGDNAIIRLVFNKPINPLTVNATTVQLTANGTMFVADSISFSNNNQMALLVPHSPLPDNTLMTLTISGITDGAGNPVAPQTTQFTTGFGPDVTAPLLASANPHETNVNQPPTNVPLNTVVQLQVNEPVDPGTVNSNTFQILQGGHSVPGTYSVSADGQTITFVPSSSLAASQSYAVNFSGEGITDLAGNILMTATNGGPNNFSFTTGTSASTNAPQVAGTSPATGATGIPINAHVLVQFNEPVNATKLSGVYLTGPGGTVAASQTLTNGSQTLTLIPTTVLAAGAQYTINIAGVQDMSGNVLVAPVTAIFTTGTSADLNPPKVSSTSPASYATGVPTSATVQVQFSKAVDPLTVTASTFELFPYSTMILVPGVISFSPDATTVTFTPSQALDSATSYVISLSSGIIDLEGQTLQPMNYYFTTTQGALGLAPVIATTSPSAAGVGTSVTINGTYFGTSQGSSTVTFNGVQATVTSWSDVQIVASVPSGATTGPLVVTVNGTNSNNPQFDVTATPVITSISPSSATVGTVLTITGTNFGDAADSVGINFPQNLYPPPPALTPISRSPTSITVAVPSAAMSGNVIVAVDGVSSAGSAFTFIPTPNITSLSTYSGVPGTSVYIFGTNFGASQGTSTVNFNGVAASVTSWGNSQIIVVAPSNVTTGPITVVANSVTSNSNVVFTVTTPAISSLSPPDAAAGATVTLNGSGLAAQGLTTQVFFNGVAASVASASSNSVTVVVPANATSGLVTAVLGPDTSNGVEFTLDSPPAISAISPTTALYGGAVTITGSGFGATQSNSSVNFYLSNTAPQVQSWSDSSITVLVPADATTGPLTVTVGGVAATAPSWFNVSTQTQITDSLGNQTTYTLTAAGGEWFSSSSSGPGCSTCTVRGNITSTPDANGNALTSTDDLGNTTTYTYDSNNNMTSASKPLNANTTQTTSYTYNSFGEVLTTTDPLGNVTTNAYDPNGNLLTVTTPVPNSNTPASVTQFQYATNGELTQITDPKGNVTKLTYTPAGLIASITDAQNNVTSYQYDARGNRTAVIDPVNGASHPTSFVYDIMNRLTGITYPDGTTAGFTYDVRGRRTSATDQNGKTTTYTYDDADRLTAVTDPANNSTQYAYDTEDNLLSITDANNHITQFAYNARGWVTQTTFPSTLQESYTYDLVGHLLSKTDRKNQTIQYVYDALYRLSSKTYPDSTSVEYAYDLAGRVLQVSDPTGTYGFAYDNMGRLIGTSTQYSYMPGLNFQNAYSYDAASNRTSLTAPDGSVTTYGYDTLNRLNGLGNSWAGSFGFGYDALSRRTSLTRPNGVNASYSYDSVSHLLSVLHQAGSTVLDGASYTYDSAGNRLSKTNYLNGVTSNYGYDPLYELTQVTQGASTTESYSYDAVGNRLSSLTVPNYTYNGSNELTSNSNGSYTYDANGNTLSDAQGRSFTWDFENRLIQAVVPGTNGGTTTFRYDPFGRRIQKSGPLGTTNYLYDGMNSIEDIDGAGNELAGYTQSRGIDQPLAEIRSGTTSFYSQDGLGSVTSLSNSTSGLASTYTYDSFGKLTASTGTLVNPFQYTGRDFDQETGTYYYRARYYDPGVGRFANEDPTEFRSDDLNLYSYVHGSPINYTDPTGLAKTYDCGAGCGFRIERDPHKGLHVNWWCNGLSGCLLIPSMQPCEVGRSDQPPSRITRCIREKLKIPQPQPAPPCQRRISLPDLTPVIEWSIIVGITIEIGRTIGEFAF